LTYLAAAVPAEHIAQLGDLLPILEFLSEKLDSVQVDSSIADGSTNSNQLPGTWSAELHFDLSSYRQVRKSKEANTAFAHPNAATIDHRRIRYHANRGV